MFYFGTNTKQQLNQEQHEEVVEIAALLAKSNKDTQFFVLPTMPLLVPLKKMSFGSGLWVGPQRVSGTLMSIYCMGESEKERSVQTRKDIFAKQLKVLKELNIERALIGYEPVWSIGVNGTPAESSYVEESFDAIKSVLTDLGLNLKNFPLCYGGSVNIDNAKELAALDNCDGLFVGRSAWSKDGFRNVYDKAHAGFRSKQDLSA
jgi:triosephosphate isomerase